MKVSSYKFLLILAAILTVWGYIYSDALFAMEEIWRSSDTFAHGYFMLPISIWLVWRDREYLLTSYTKSSFVALPLLAGSLFIGLFAFAADINVLSQLSAVTSLIIILWLLIGNNLAWRYKFPLAYLLFLVPMGENLIPWLQDVTAWFTVVFLKIHGIPVFRDGLYIQVPTGLFEVAVACSGIRYLIASIAVGTLYAYLSYRSFYKQLTFILFSAFLPILANGIRAYGIVIIAYYSDMKYATGVDHLIYGWLFFGLVMMLMFYVGGKFADEERKSTVNTSPTIVASSSSKVCNFVALILLISVAGAIGTLSSHQKPIEPLPALTAIQNANPVEQSNWGIVFKDGLQRSHLNTSDGVEFFRAVYGNKQSEGEMINFVNKLYNHNSWTIVASKVVDVKGLAAKVVHLRSIDSNSRSFIYHYKVGDHYLVSNPKAKLLQALNNIFKQSTKSEILAVSIRSSEELADVEKQLIAAFELLPKMSTSDEK